MTHRVLRGLPSVRSNLSAMPTTEIADEPEMPRTQVMALLQVRAGGPDSLFAKVLHYLKAVGSDEPDAYDLTQLREAGYLVFHGPARRHVLTPPGLHKAERLAKDLARQFQIHHITVRPAGARTNMGPSAWCSCGHWHPITSRKRGGEDRLRREGADHLDLVARGAWKAPRPIQEFLNEVMPPRLPLERRI